MKKLSESIAVLVAVMAGFSIIAFGVALLVGWALNIVKLVPMADTTGVLVLRAVGIVVWPLGIVLGFIG